MDIRVGQIWKNKRRKPDSAFTIYRVYTKPYDNGDSATRVTGVLSMEHGTQSDRDMDARSMARMFPHLLFEPPSTEIEEHK